MTWRARLASYSSVPIGSVPSNAFTLNAPAGAHVESQDQGAQDFLALMASTCHSTAQGVLSDMQSHRDSTGLQICRDTNPTITADQLVASLLAAPKAYCAKQVASGQMSPREAATELANGATKMTYFVSTPVRALSILNP
jgi:hypothetical protein